MITTEDTTLGMSGPLVCSHPMPNAISGGVLVAGWFDMPNQLCADIYIYIYIYIYMDSISIYIYMRNYSVIQAGSYAYREGS